MMTKNRLIEFQRMAEDIKNCYRKKLINKTIVVLFENKMKIEIDILVEMTF